MAIGRLSKNGYLNENLRLLRFTSHSDKLLIFIGCLFALGTGITKPIQGLIVTNLSNAFIIYSREISNTNNSAFSTETAFNQLYSTVIWHCFLWLLLTIASFLLGYVQTYCLLLAGENLANKLQKAYFKSLLNQDVAWFDSHKTGSLISEMKNNIDSVKEGTGMHIGTMVHTIFQVIGSFTVCIYYNWKLGQIVTCLLPLAAFFGKYMHKILDQLYKPKRDTIKASNVVFNQALSCMKTVAYFNGQKEECKRYNSHLKKELEAGLNYAIAEGVNAAVPTGLIFLTYALIVYIGTQYVYDGLIDGGVVVMIFMQVRISLVVVPKLFFITGNYNFALRAAADLFEVIENEPEVEEDSDDCIMPKLTGELEYRNISFSYPTRKEIQVLKDISFTINAGETVALVGSSGSGKSTIVQLLLRTYHATRGKISVNGNDIQRICRKHLRNSIGIVSQEPILFNTTIEENIRYGRENITEAEIWIALRKANAKKFVKEFPQGLKTIVGDRGTQLSGGQKQRIAIARALVKDPKILILDEATSALDANNERIAQDALEQASKGRTTLIIAHRLSTIRNADKIIAMRNGEIVEMGPHNELILKNGVYHDLVKSQVFLDSNPSEIRCTATLRSISHEPQEKPKSVKLRSSIETKHQKVTSVATIFWKIIAETGPQCKILYFGIGVSLVKGLLAPLGFFGFTELTKIFSGPKETYLYKGKLFGMIYVALAIFFAFAAVVQNTCFSFVVQNLAARLREKMFSNLIRQDTTFYDKSTNSAGQLHVHTDVNPLKPVVNNRIGRIFQEICTDLIGCSVALYYCWQIAVIAIPLFPLASIGIVWKRWVASDTRKELQKDAAISGQIALEAITHIRTVKHLNLQDKIYEKYCELMDKSKLFHMQLFALESFTFGVYHSIHFLIYTCLYVVGLYLIRNFGVDPQMFLRSLYLIGWGSNTAATWIQFQPELLKATVAAEKIFEIIKVEPGIDAMNEDGKRPEIKGNIKIKNLYFSYPERKDIQVIKGMNLDLKQGQTIALVGASGCGKSTTVSLLERLYDPEEGNIEIDGCSLTEMNLQHWRSNISIVSQEPILFDLSIRENILYGLEEFSVSNQEMVEAAKKANIHEFISSLPLAYQTRVGDKGTQLSGGQKQRIAIARALVRNPKILLLDEATSALDTESEKHVQQALEEASQGRSCLVVAHRLSTIRKADQILVFSGGRIVEKGNHEELMSKKGEYFKLVQKQSHSY